MPKWFREYLESLTKDKSCELIEWLDTDLERLVILEVLEGNLD